MNKKAQGGILSFIFSLIVFIIIWSMWLGKVINEWGARAITDNSLTGVEAFLFANLNLWIFLGLIIGMFFITYFGGSNR